MEVFFEYLNNRLLPRDFKAIIASLALACVIYVLFYLLKNIFRRLKYAGVPGVKFYFFDLFGNIALYPLIGKGRNGYSVHTLFMQYTEGFCRLFPNESIILVWMGFHPLGLANKPEAIQAIMTDSSLIEKPLHYKFVEPIIGEGILTSKGSKWKPRRKMLNPSFRPNILMDFMPVYNENAGKLVKKLQEGTDEEVVELIKPISLCVLDIVCETILGTNIGAQDNKNKSYVEGLRSLFTIAMERTIKFYQWPGFAFDYSKIGREFYKNLETVHGLTHSVLKQKKEEYIRLGSNPNKKIRPLMDLLLEFHMEKDTINEDGIIEEVETFAAAANESTAGSLMFTFHLVGLDKAVQDTAHQELDDIFGNDRERPVEKEDLSKMKYIECILKESLRLFPTVPMFAREALEDKVVCGHKFPKGTSFAVIPFILHRDPQLYPDPERFDPSRFFPENSADRSHYAYIPFSAGARNCIGQKFAMIEMKVVLAHILRNFTVESLDPRDKILAAPELTLRTDLPVRFKLHPRK